MLQSLHELWFGFGVAFEGHNLMWSFFGVLVGNLIGVLPGMGAISAMSILLPLTYALHPVAAIMMLGGVFYGSMYGGAIGAILLNLPSHAAHAVTCLDGYPMTRAGKGGTALGIAMISSFFAASIGILVMIFASPLLIAVSFKLGPADMFSILMMGLLSGATMSRGSPIKGVAMTLFGLLCGIVGADVNNGVFRFTFGIPALEDGLELTAIALGLFGVADFLLSVNRMKVIKVTAKLRVRDMRPSLKEMKEAFWPTIRGTGVGVLFGAMPGTGPIITSFIAYALERKVSKTPEKFGTGMIAGVAAPEASTHSKTQVDFIPTLGMGIPGDVVMALILAALLIQGIQPGPLLMTEHRDLFWGVIASFWIGNVLLMVLNVPLIGVWVKLLRVPYRYLFPSAMFFIAVGVYSTQNSLFVIWELLAFGVIGAVFMALDFPIAPILLGIVLGPMMEENFRRALLLSGGNMEVFVTRPVSGGFIAACAVLLIAVTWSSWRAGRRKRNIRGSRTVDVPLGLSERE